MTTEALTPAAAEATSGVVMSSASISLPRVIVEAGPVAMGKFVEFFAGRIANERTRAAYARAVGQFLGWCEARGLHLEAVSPLHVAAYIRTHPGSGPTVKQHLAAILRRSSGGRRAARPGGRRRRRHSRIRRLVASLIESWSSARAFLNRDRSRSPAAPLPPTRRGAARPPTSSTRSCGSGCCQPCPRRSWARDQSDLANLDAGDRKARFEQTAERHAGLSQFAGPFLSRMKFVDEQGAGASPTRRPPHVPFDFAPAVLQPLIRHDGVTDQRRWESALFLPGVAPAPREGREAARRAGPPPGGGHGDRRRDRAHRDLNEDEWAKRGAAGIAFLSRLA